MDERTLRGVEVVKASLDGLNHPVGDVALHVPDVNTTCAYYCRKMVRRTLPLHFVPVPKAITGI